MGLRRLGRWVLLTGTLVMTSSVCLAKGFGALPRLNLREPDQPGQANALNQEVWEFARHTPYAQIQRYVAATQTLSHPTTDPAVTIPTGWHLHPAGVQVPLGTLPSAALLYHGFLVVLNGGYSAPGPPTVSVVDLPRHQIVKTLKLPSLFPSGVVGLDGNLYISGGSSHQVYRLNQDFQITATYNLAGYTAGITPLDADHLVVTYLTTPGHPQGEVVLLDTKTGQVERQVPVGYYPYSVERQDGKLFVTLLGEDKLLVLGPQLQVLRTLTVGELPQNTCGSGHQLYVVNSGSDYLSVVNTKTARITGKLPLGQGRFKFGISPTACVVSPQHLYVSEAQLNAVALYNPDSRAFQGFIPVGWYPTQVLERGHNLLVVSAKGIEPTRPNPQGPQPIPGRGGRQYVLYLLKGALSIVAEPEIPTHLQAWTAQVAAGSPLTTPAQGPRLPIRHVFYIIRENRTYDQVLGDLGQGNGDPHLTLFGWRVTPNAHQLAKTYVTLDNFYADGEISVLGHSYTTSGYASPFLEWLGNNSYSGRYHGYPFGTVPATFSPGYLWNILEAKGLDYRIYGEPYYLFTRAYQIIVADYGADSPLARHFYAQSLRLAKDDDRGNDPMDLLRHYYGQASTFRAALGLLANQSFAQQLSQTLVGDDSLALALRQNPHLRSQMALYLVHYPFNYPGFDLHYSDLQRFQDWHQDFEGQLRRGKVPALEYIWLPNDHTAGVQPGYLNPYQLVAQNDAALGKIVQTISHSPVWAHSLVLIEEDDAQDGPDHVDATRTVALAVGPYVRRGAIVSDHYDQLSLLRTIEVVLGLPPINLNDGLAVPMVNIFTTHPDFRPYNPPPSSPDLTPADRALESRG